MDQFTGCREGLEDPRTGNATQFGAAFQRFMAKFASTVQGVVAIDGKDLRRRFDRASGKSPLHMVSAWGCEQRLVLAQIATDAKSNEITAVAKLLEMLSLKGTIVTADALNRQRAIAQQIVDRGGDHALALKGNQGTPHADVSTFLLARPGRHRQGGPYPGNREQDHHRDRLPPSRHSAIRDTLQRGRPRALGCRKPAALVA